MPRFISHIFLSAFLFLGIAPSLLQAEWPEHAITVIVPWTAGGSTDRIARELVPFLSRELGQRIAIANITGDSSLNGHNQISRARPDGHTLGIISNEINLFQAWGRNNLGFKEFTPIGLLSLDPYVLLTSALEPFDSIDRLISELRFNPKSRYRVAGSGGFTGQPFLALAGLLDRGNISFNALHWLPDKSSSGALKALLSGEANFAVTTLSQANYQLRTGRLRALALMAEKRSANFPDIPTLAEATGIKWHYGRWRGLAGPPGLDDDVVRALKNALSMIFKNQFFAEQLHKSGYDTMLTGDQDFRSFLEKDFGNINSLVKRLKDNKIVY